MKLQRKLLSIFTVFVVFILLGFVKANASSVIPESDHPYDKSIDQTWTYKDPNVKSNGQLKIYFNEDTYVESGYDYIYIYNANETQLYGKYTGNELAGATITVPGNSFTIRLTSDYLVSYYGFKIDKIEGTGPCIQDEDVTLAYTSTTYNGYARKPNVTVYHNGTKLTKGRDYTLSYKKNTYPGTATVTVTGKGKYEGSVTKTFTIKPLDIDQCKVTLSKTSYTYSGKARKPTVTVKYGSKTISSSNYTVKYSNNTKAGKATVTIKGRYNLTGERKVSFKINPISLSKCKFSSISSKTYTGKAIKPTVKVTFDSKTVSSKNYTVKYSNNTNAGTAKITIKGKGNYSGTKTLTFKINKLNIAKCSFAKISARDYTGKAIKPSVTVKNGSTKISSSNYKVKYSNNTKVGTAKITITGTKNTYGKKVISFKINPVLSKTKKGIYEDQTYTLKLKGVSVDKVTFKSSDTSVCTVNSEGVITAKDTGSCKITATYKGEKYVCKIQVLAKTTESDTSFYKNHDDVPDFGAMLKIEPSSSVDGSEYTYTISDLQKVDPDQEAGDNYRKLLVNNNFSYEGKVTKSGKRYYKYVSEKKIVYFGIASENDEVKIIIELA